MLAGRDESQEEHREPFEVSSSSAERFLLASIERASFDPCERPRDQRPEAPIAGHRQWGSNSPALT